MGTFDYVKFECKCPCCGSLLNDFQTKDGFNMMERIDFYPLRRFYTFCDKCGLWVEFRRKPATSINDFLIIVKRGDVFKPKWVKKLKKQLEVAD